MTPSESLPADFLESLRALEDSYCAETDPIRQSGFGGGPQQWRAEREPILDAVDTDGDFLDVGCANGYLLECLVAWGEERGYRLTPHGLDIGPRLVQMAKERLPDFAANFHVGNAWDWQPPRQWRYVYSLLECVPEECLREYLGRLLERMVENGGKLIVGVYGSRSKHIAPIDLGERLARLGFEVQGTAYGGTPRLTSFAWIAR
jgi:SAM-dependent methyltransferase